MKSEPEQHRVFKGRVDGSGRVVIPADARLRKLVKEGDTIVIEEDGNGLRIRTVDDAVREAQEYFCAMIPAGVSLVDELIAERREEAERE